jgi:hypothetical protein
LGSVSILFSLKIKHSIFTVYSKIHEKIPSPVEDGHHWAKIAISQICRQKNTPRENMYLKVKTQKIVKVYKHSFSLIRWITSKYAF